ncbi:MAG: hypothetical protein ACYC5M_11210 [Anaerolineae bacterium]
MTGTRRWLGLVLSLVVILAGCGRVGPGISTVASQIQAAVTTPAESTGTPLMVETASTLPTPTATVSPTSRPTTVTATPTATPTATSTPTAMPVQSGAVDASGRLPLVLAALDLGSSVGNAYLPAVAAADDASSGYVLCQSCGSLNSGASCIAVVDLASGRLRALYPLPGTSTGPLAVGNGLLYAYISDNARGSRLVALDAASGEVRADVAGEYVRGDDTLWLDASGEHLLVPLYDRLAFYDAGTLAPVGEFPYPQQAPDRHVYADVAADRLYLTLADTLYAYRAADFNLLWQARAEGATLTSLAADTAGGLVAAMSVTVEGDNRTNEILLYTAEGELLRRFAPETEASGWTLAQVQGQAGRIVYQTFSYPPVGPGMVLWTTDLEGQPTSERLHLPGLSAPWAPRPGSTLYLASQSAHELVVVDAAALAVTARAQVGVELRHTLLDAARERLYVNDAAGNLYELDTSAEGALPLMQRAQAGAGMLALDAESGLLLVAEASGDPQRVSVVRLEGLQPTQVITGGAHVAWDTRRGRALVGPSGGGYPPGEGQTQVWDVARAVRVGAIPQAGPPAYNPLRDEIYVAGYTCRAYDAETLTFKNTLTPDIEAQECQGCTGQPAVADVSVHADLNLLAVHMTVVTAGKGPGTMPAPRWFTLDTLKTVTSPTILLEACPSGWLLWPPQEGSVFEPLLFSRYTVRANVVVREAGSGEVRAWRDGLVLRMLSPDGRTAYAALGDDWLALDTRTWTPLGWTTPRCVSALGEEGRVYALEGSTVVALRMEGGDADAPPPPAPGAPQSEIRALYASPAHAQDRTLFAEALDGLYRSQDGGVTWARLRGGLPEMRYLGAGRMPLAISPSFAQDGTLLAAGNDGGASCFGVWRSTDGGDSWRAVWDGLTHLCVAQLAFSPTYATDGTVVALSQYTNLFAADTGVVAYRSTDHGSHWQPVAQESRVESADATLDADAFLPEGFPRERLRLMAGERALELLRDDGTWATVLRFPADDYQAYPIQQLASPRFAEDRTLVVLMPLGLLRSTDAGATWQMATGTPVDGRTFEQRLTAMALGEDGTGGLTLVVGDVLGHVYVLPMEEMTWSALPWEDTAARSATPAG